jgi:hypothetical protein
MTLRKSPKSPIPKPATPLDKFVEDAKNQVLDVISGAVDETGMSRRQASLMRRDLIGRWRMTRLSLWDARFMDAEVPAFIEFRTGGRGTFHFGYVHCEIDWRPEQRQSRPGAAFTFEGNDEMDTTMGRGWAAVQFDGTLRGHLYFHQGDDSGFWAEKIVR